MKQYEIVKGIDGKEYLFFYGGFLSQWSFAEFIIDDITYKCAEQYMMAEKARLFNDNDILEKILATGNPSECKRLGRKISGFNADIWNEHAMDIVYKGNMSKFSQDLCLKSKLMNNTGHATLVEASPYDIIWGIGMGIEHPDILDPSKWRGKNWLGEVCTKVREAIR